MRYQNAENGWNGGTGTHSRNRTGCADYHDSSFEFIPSFGYFVSDGILVGINLGLSSGKVDSFGGETKSSGFAAGPFARYYKQTSNENFSIYGQFSFLYGSGKETGSSNQETKTSAMDIAVSPGLVYFLNNHWVVELGFRGIGYYSSDPDKDVDNDNVKTFDIGLNSFCQLPLVSVFISNKCEKTMTNPFAFLYFRS